MIYLLLAVIVIAILLIWAPKNAGFVLIGAAVLVLSIGGLVYWGDYKEKTEIEKVEVSLSLDEAACPGDSSLSYRISNNADDNVYRVYFRYTVYRKGYSSPVSKSYGNEVTEDKIIEPNSSFSNCIVPPSLDPNVPSNELEFVIDHQRVWSNQPIH